MRPLLFGMLAFLPLLHAQDSLLKSAEPDYEKYSQELSTDFDVVSASVTITVLANGTPLTLDNSSIPLPMAVAMALKDYAFRPKAEGPHGRGETEVGTYQITLSVPVRQSKNPVGDGPSVIRVNSAIAKGLLTNQVRPEYPEFARHNRIEATITFLDAVINQQGKVESLKTNNGPFLLIEAAHDAVKEWEWRPFLLNHTPVDIHVDLEMNFRLK